MPVTASPESLTGTRYARNFSLIFGAFLVLWAFVGRHRWDGHGYDAYAHAESVFFLVFGGVLLLPWKRLNTSRHWAKLFGLVCVLCVAFAFVMVCEVMALNYIADDAHRKAMPPVFQGVLLFAALGQVPTLLFYRRPELLD